MLARFRKSSKNKIPQVQPNYPAANTPKEPKRTTFFDLPAEIRNAIYELIAQDLTLILDLNHNKTSKHPSLLLASRQTNKEFSSILLSTATLKVPIIDFNFTTLLSYIKSGGLPPNKSKSLFSNPNLIITLQLKKCRSDVYANVKTWCETSTQERGLWGYELREKAGTNSMHLEWFSARVRVLQQRVESAQAKGEAGRILEVLGEAMRDVQIYAGGFGQGFGDAFVEIAARRRI
ncbi:hypothetical protein HII31_08684 [Pseudocercospora fuligena]|uniref:Uncharacterized protein n=1 Tax=Pseudocercospora fuligena TaxID=685502 RepID=A0A8H6RG18_9PEZI|nr:hypothetical protein HII31_08684 [Pseudocercospora fuligena]